MSWELKLAVRGDLQTFLDAELKAGKRAVTSVIRRRSNNMKNDVRRQIARAGMGQRLGKTVQNVVYPKRGVSLNAAAFVLSKAVYKNRPRGPVDLIQVFNESSTVTLPGGRALAIPLPAAGEGTGKRNDPVSRRPSDWPAGTFQMVPSKDRKTALLIFRSGSKKGQPAFILVRGYKRTKKIDVDRAYTKAVRNLDQAIVNTWNRATDKIETSFNVNVL